MDDCLKVSIAAAVGGVLTIIYRCDLAQFLYNWQTLIAGVLAVGAAAGTIWTTIRSANQEILAKERDRTERAEVVAFRLSGWLGEVAALIQTTSGELKTLLLDHTPAMPPFSQDIVNKLKLDASGRIENVISDLHYLKTGSGDVAQLDFFTGYFDAYLNRALRKMPLKGGYSAEDLDVIYKHVADLLKQLQTHYENAHRHIEPIIDTTIKRDSMKPRASA